MPIASILPDVDILDVSLHDWVLDGVRKHGNQVAMIDSSDGSQWTYTQVLYSTFKIAAALQTKIGIHKGDVVMFYMGNYPQQVISILATSCCGAIASGANPALTKHELRRQVEDCKPTIIFTDSQGLENARQIANLVDLPLIICEESSMQYSKATLRSKEWSFDQLLLTTNSEDYKRPEIMTKTDLCLLPYSSGTTGLPKGVMVSHYNFVSMTQIFNNRSFFLCATPGTRTISVLPMYHVFGLMQVMPALRDGVTLVTLRIFKPDIFLGLLQDHKVEFQCMVPPLVVLLAKNPMVSKYDVTSLQVIFCGAAPLGKKLSMDLKNRHPNIKYLLQGYGMTEFSGATTATFPSISSQQKYGSCGVIMPNCQAKVINMETGEELGPNIDGELWWKGPGSMIGYLNKISQTQATIDSDGWLHSGDIGHYDEDGFLYVIDRLKELIKVKGFQVAPAELEDYLLELESVVDAAVVGEENEKCGEIPVAFVVPNGNANQHEILSAINNKVARFKQLGRVIFVDSLPKSPSGKILRRILREKLKPQSKM